jgi:hypothetical protein
VRDFTDEPPPDPPSCERAVPASTPLRSELPLQTTRRTRPVSGQVVSSSRNPSSSPAGPVIRQCVSPSDAGRGSARGALGGGHEVRRAHCPPAFPSQRLAAVEKHPRIVCSVGGARIWLCAADSATAGGELSGAPSDPVEKRAVGVASKPDHTPCGFGHGAIYLRGPLAFF